MDLYTPTTEEIREYVKVGGEPRPWASPTTEIDSARAAAFDRWLAARDRAAPVAAAPALDSEPTLLVSPIQALLLFGIPAAAFDAALVWSFELTDDVDIVPPDQHLAITGTATTAQAAAAAAEKLAAAAGTTADRIQLTDAHHEFIVQMVDAQYASLTWSAQIVAPLTTEEGQN